MKSTMFERRKEAQRRDSATTQPNVRSFIRVGTMKAGKLRCTYGLGDGRFIAKVLSPEKLIAEARTGSYDIVGAPESLRKRIASAEQEAEQNRRTQTQSRVAGVKCKECGAPISEKAAANGQKYCYLCTSKMSRTPEGREKLKQAAGTDAFITDQDDNMKELDTDDVRLDDKVPDPLITASRKKASDVSNVGHYVTLVQTDNNWLRLVPNHTTIKEFIHDNEHHLQDDFLMEHNPDYMPPEKRFNVWGDDQTLQELLADHFETGWTWVRPEDIGALTSAPILEAPDGRIYWHERHAVESGAEELLRGQTFSMEGAPENKPYTSEPATPPVEGEGEEPDDESAPAKKSSLRHRAAPKTEEEHWEAYRSKNHPDDPDLRPEDWVDGTNNHPGFWRAPHSRKRPVKGSLRHRAIDDLATAPPEPNPPMDDPPIGKYQYWTAEALSVVIEALSKISDFTDNKAAQQAVAEMAKELNGRPKTTPEEPKVAARKRAEEMSHRRPDLAWQNKLNSSLSMNPVETLANIKELCEDAANYPNVETFDQIEEWVKKQLLSYEEQEGRNITGSQKQGTSSASYFTTNEETSKVLEGDKSVPDGRDKEENPGDIPTIEGATVPNKVGSRKVGSIEIQFSSPTDQKVYPFTGTIEEAKRIAQENSSAYRSYLIKVVENGNVVAQYFKGYEKNPGGTPNKVGKTRKRAGNFKVGDRFTLSPDALQNYGEQYKGKVFTVRAIYDHHVPVSEMHNDDTGHPGFDEAGGSPLYGSELNFDLYEWEMEPAGSGKNAAYVTNEDTSKILEGDHSIPGSHDKQEDKTGITYPATTMPSKLAGEMSTNKAINMAEAFGDKLKEMYLDSKVITQANDTRPVREAVESIYHAMQLFSEAVSTLNKQQRKEQAEEESQEAAKPGKKSSRFLGSLNLAGATAKG